MMSDRARLILADIDRRIMLIDQAREAERATIDAKIAIREALGKDHWMALHGLYERQRALRILRQMIIEEMTDG